MKTWMCDNGNHGTRERRYAVKPDGRLDFTPMFTGSCAGTVFNPSTHEEAECECACHILPACESCGIAIDDGFTHCAPCFDAGFANPTSLRAVQS